MLGTNYIWTMLCLQFLGLSHQESCETFSQNVEPGITYYAYSPDYPKNQEGNSCIRFEAIAPLEHEIVAECSIEIHQSKDCVDAAFYFSRTGDMTLKDAQTLCGFGKKNFTSMFRNAAIGYQSNGKGEGSRFVCSLTAHPACDCGWSQISRIVGGNETEIGQFPSMAGVVDTITKNIRCGGTIISHYLVLTAAHCVKYGSTENILVAVGLINKAKGSPHTKLYQVANIFKPPNHDDRPNDIALLRTASEIEWSREVGPACLPFGLENANFRGVDVYIVGWGLLTENGQRPDILRNVIVNVISNYECEQSYPHIHATEICTYAPGKDACQYDSGGPLLFVRDRQYLVGIVSYGNGCAFTSAVNTRVTSFLNWIKGIADDTLCYKKLYRKKI